MMTFLQKGLGRFRQNTAAVWAFRSFSFLCMICFLCPLWCNEKPLIIAYQNQLFFPLCHYIPETTFGGSFDLETDYQSPSFSQTIQKEKGWILWPLLSYGPTTIDWDKACPAPPSRRHWLGTDDQGRDVCVRLFYSLRTALIFSLWVCLCTTAISLLAGAIQGYFGGWIDLLFQRVIEIWMGLPILFVLMIVSSLIRPTLFWLIVLVVAFSWPVLVELTRAEFLRARRIPYVQAAQVLGAKPFAIIQKHILPNALISVISYLPFLMSQAISLLVSLDFLGFGLPSQMPSLGDMLAQGKQNLYAPWLGLTGFFGMAILLLLITFIGEGLRDAFDTRRP